MYTAELFVFLLEISLIAPMRVTLLISQ